MTIRRLNINEIVPFDYEFDGLIGGQMTDVGRNIGSANIGLNIQTVPPGNFSSRRHRHLFQEEILVVMSGTGLLHHRLRYEICEYPDRGVAFVEGLGSEIPLAHLTESDWTEERRRR